MTFIGLTFLLLGFIEAFCIGLDFDKINNIKFVISFILLVCLYIFGVLCIAYQTEYLTLLEYANGNIGYEVTEINIESGKATSIEVINEVSK